MVSPKTSIRRSVALPAFLVQQAMEVADPELCGNFNRLVRRLLEDYVERKRAREFEDQMRAMASDQDIQREIFEMNVSFESTEGDGL